MHDQKYYLYSYIENRVRSARKITSFNKMTDAQKKNDIITLNKQGILQEKYLNM